MKLLFVEQHSMKLGDSVFYNIEMHRQHYLKSFEALPMWGGFVGIGIFIMYAYKMPLSSNLYMEAFKSLIFGTAIASSYPAYMRTKYLDAVTEAYDHLKQRFDVNPEQNVPDSDGVAKNFGMSRWNTEDVDSEEDLMADDAMGFFDGKPDDDKKEMKARFYADI